MSTVVAGPTETADSERPIDGGTVAWAGHPGFPPSTIFPFTPPERIGIRNLFEFQVLMYRPLYWLGKNGQPDVDLDLSLALPPEWSDDGRTVTVTLKPWKWSNGEPICADNVMFWVNMLAVKAARYGNYAPGYFPDNLTSYQKVAADKVRFTFDRVYSKTWVLMNQLSFITPMPRAWDRTADDAPANASADRTDVPAVYDYLVTQNGPWDEEDNEFRTRWPDSPVWSVVNGPWRLKSFTRDGTVTFVPNEHYSGPARPHLDEFRLVPVSTDEQQYAMLAAGDQLQVGYLPYGLDTEPGGSAGEPADHLANRYRLVQQYLYMVHYMPLNFDNPAVAGRIIRQAYFRQALQYCVDQDTAIRNIFHGHGHRTCGPVPTVPDSGLLSPAQRAGTMQFDLQRARSLLASHGWDVSTTPAVCVRPGTGPGCAGEGIGAGANLTFRLRYVEGRAALRKLMHQLQADAARAGIELHLEEVYGSAMVAQDHGESEPDNPHRWELQCWNGGWAFYGQPTGEMLFRTGGGSNFGHYSDPRADELIARVGLSDSLSVLHEYQDYLAEQVPVVWMPGFPAKVLEVARNLRGIEPLNPYGLLTPENLYFVED